MARCSPDEFLVSVAGHRSQVHCGGMRESRQRRLIASAILSAGLLVVAACTAAPVPVDPPAVEQPPPETPEKPASPVEKPSPPVEPATVRLPTDCDALIPAAALAPGLQQYPNLVPGWAITMFGPKTHEVVLAGDSLLMCGWGLPQSDAIAVVAVSIVSEPAKSALIASLKGSIYEDASGFYKDLGVDPEVAYKRPPAQDLQYVSTVLIDGLVVVAASQTINGEFAGEALRTIQGLNGE